MAVGRKRQRFSMKIGLVGSWVSERAVRVVGVMGWMGIVMVISIQR